MARAAVATHIADTSAQARVDKPEVRERLSTFLDAGLLATCTVLDIELLRSARSAGEYDAYRAERELFYEQLPLEQPIFTRALEVQQRLAASGSHRAVPLADLVIAAVAELHEVTVLHYDADFDRIAKITGQSAEWIVPRGSVD